jgi:hypothetical protein
MPVTLLEAVALHHQPDRCGRSNFSALTAVHAANAFEHELRGPKNGDTASTLDLPYIDSLGLMERIDEWKQCLREGKLPSQQGRSPTPPGEDTLIPTSSVDRTGRQKRWLATAGAVAIIASLGLWLGNRWHVQESLPARAKSQPGDAGSNEAASSNIVVTTPDVVRETNAASLPPNGALPPAETQPPENLGKPK